MASSAKKRVTSSQVAERAGVSRTAVSFVLNGVPSSGISEETRERVLRAAAELGYVPNAAARSLVSGSSRTIALVIPHNEHVGVDGFIPILLSSINKFFHERDFAVLLESVEDVAEPGAYVRLVNSRRVDGLIMVNPRDNEEPHLRELAKGRFPVVLLGPQDLRIEDVHSIGLADKDASYLPVEHLIKLGHRDIAHITFAPLEYQSVQTRLLGYQEALRDNGIEYRPELVVQGNISAESGYRAMQELLSSDRQPTAVFAGNDVIAFGAMRAIVEAGRRIPDDIALVGFDDIPLSEFATPPLSTCHTDPRRQGLLAAEMLHQLICGQRPASMHMTVGVELVVRQSCGSFLNHHLTT